MDMNENNNFNPQENNGNQNHQQFENLLNDNNLQTFEGMTQVNNVNEVENLSNNNQTVENSINENNNVMENHVEPEVNDNTTENVTSANSNTPKKKKSSVGILVIILIILIGIVAALVGVLLLQSNNGKENVEQKEIKSDVKASDYRLSGNSLENFDLYFLQLENEKMNKIYSPLSIKYALQMLAEGSDGDSKAQLDAVIGDYKANKYVNSENMSFANALFIRDTFKDSIKEEYKTLLLNKYNAEVILDSFETPTTINNWVKDKTLNLLDNFVDDVSDLDFALINALAIDMEWNQKFLGSGRPGYTSYSHERKPGTDYQYSWFSPDNLVSFEFKDVDEDVSGMKIIASLNNYDIVTKLGEGNIRKTVGDEYRKFLREDEYCQIRDFQTNLYRKCSELTEEEINQAVQRYLDSYIEEINSNYRKVDYNTDFSLYVDDDVKVFAKDLKEYNGKTLQYVGIMPVSIDLDSYVKDLNANKVNVLLNNLKEIKLENFNDGVVTEIRGYIPKFKFEYTLKLKEDLEKLGITDVFDNSKANLTNITSNKGAYIAKMLHKANIEFTQDGIKASAATFVGGAGAGGDFDYYYEVPFEEIDLTFDKPYMFIIRDKNTGEVWFTGMVYNPLLWKDDNTKAM